MRSYFLMCKVNMDPQHRVADVNGDGRDDVLFTHSAGKAPELLLQTSSGRFVTSASQPWAVFKQSEFIGAQFFDADGDGDKDLYLAAGSTEFGATSELYADRYFQNDGMGVFTYRQRAIPEIRTPTQCVATLDLDNDDDLDLFVGGRNVPGSYPASPISYVFINDGGVSRMHLSNGLARIGNLV